MPPLFLVVKPSQASGLQASLAAVALTEPGHLHLPGPTHLPILPLLPRGPARSHGGEQARNAPHHP